MIDENQNFISQCYDDVKLNFFNYRILLNNELKRFDKIIFLADDWDKYNKQFKIYFKNRILKFNEKLKQFSNFDISQYDYDMFQCNLEEFMRD